MLLFSRQAQTEVLLALSPLYHQRNSGFPLLATFPPYPVTLWGLSHTCPNRFLLSHETWLDNLSNFLALQLMCWCFAIVKLLELSSHCENKYSQCAEQAMTQELEEHSEASDTQLQSSLVLTHIV